MKKIIGIVIVSLIILCIMIEANPFAKKSDISNPSFIEVKLHILMSEIFMHSFYKDYIDSLNLNRDDKVLDFGSGWGTEAKMLAKHLNKGGKVTCMDISPAWINATKKRLKNFDNVDYITGDITKLQISDTFDAIVIHFVWHDIDEKYRSSIMQALVLLLKPGGKIYIREPLMPERSISFEAIRNIMKINNLKELSLKEGSSFWMGMMAEGIFIK